MIMIWGRIIISNRENRDREIYDEFGNIDSVYQNKEIDQRVTEIIRGSEDADRAIIEFTNRSKEKIDSCISSVTPSLVMGISEIKNARINAVANRGIKLRYVTEITLENLEYCKEMLEFSEIRHLVGMRGNFEVADEKEYVATATPKETQPIPLVIFSNIPELVEQQQFVFDSFWDKAIPAEQKIDELEKGIVSSITNILTDYREAEIKEFEMIRSADKNIKIIYSTPDAFYLQEKSGVLELLKKKADRQKNLHISILLPIDSSIKESSSLKLLTQTINDNIQIQDIQPNINIKIKALEVDTKESLVMEIKELREKLGAVIGFSIYSNSLPTVLTYSSIFEMIRNQSIRAEELRREGEIKDEFINTAAHELRTPTQAITGNSEMNEELLGEILKNGENMTKDEIIRNLINLRKQQRSISRNATRLDDLINKLLDIARFETNRQSEIILYKEKLDLVKEIKDIIKLEFDQRIREKNLRVSFVNSNSEEYCWVHSDRSRINQILTNLIDNAIKNSEKYDSVSIAIKDNNNFGLDNVNKIQIVALSNRLTNYDRSNDYIDKESNKQGNEKCRKDREEGDVYVSIPDTGRGISSRILPKLFEKFVTDSDFGIGLGLFITRKLVEAHGGRIQAFNNADGIGATFVFSLPR